MPKPKLKPSEIAEAVRDLDTILLVMNPKRPWFVRDYIDGEQPGLALPPGTKVRVSRDGDNTRKREFIYPSVAGN